MKTAIGALSTDNEASATLMSDGRGARNGGAHNQQSFPAESDWSRRAEASGSSSKKIRCAGRLNVAIVTYFCL
jgi:hypothetical protein